MSDARKRAEKALRMFDRTATPKPHEVYLYRAIAALREILAEEDERGAVPSEAPNPAQGGPPLNVQRVLQLAVAALHDERHHSLAEEVRSVAISLAPAPPAADEVASGTPGTYKQGGNDGNDDTARKNGRQNGDRDAENGEGSAVLGVQSADGALPDGTPRRRPDEVPILQGRAPDGTVAPAADEVREAAEAWREATQLVVFVPARLSRALHALSALAARGGA